MKITDMAEKNKHSVIITANFLNCKKQKTYFPNEQEHNKLNTTFLQDLNLYFRIKIRSKKQQPLLKTVKKNQC